MSNETCLLRPMRRGYAGFCYGGASYGGSIRLFTPTDEILTHIILWNAFGIITDRRLPFHIFHAV